ncbi:MAG: endo-1,4-beta-xylanase [Sulfuriferula sp.]|nr:endo-1,4-beta-xylanase [Sulfuriferula sp.]
MQLNRAIRWFVIAMLALQNALVMAADPLPETTTLRTLAEMRDIQIGASVDEDALRSDADYAALLGKTFDSLTPENSMKFDALHPGPFRYAFAGGDAVVDFAERHNMQVHGHVLVWHEQLPKWLTSGHWSQAQLRELLREYIFRVVGHYRGRVKTWDVVSEVIDDDGGMRQTFWSQGIGSDYVALAFQWAHEADPDAVLLYNDYGGEGGGRKSDAIFRLLQGLVAQGVPVSGVGLQMHTSVADAPEASAVGANMARLNGLGLKVYITEMDVMIPLPVTSAKLEAQAGIYRSMLRTCLAAENCRHFTLWGFTDRYSWIPSFFPGNGAALIFDKQLQPKPSYRALMDVLSVANTGIH